MENKLIKILLLGLGLCMGLPAYGDGNLKKLRREMSQLTAFLSAFVATQFVRRTQEPVAVPPLKPQLSIEALRQLQCQFSNAIFLNKIKVVKEILRQGVLEYVNASYGELCLSPLNYAFIQGYWPLVILLLNAGAHETHAGAFNIDFGLREWIADGHMRMNSHPYNVFINLLLALHQLEGVTVLFQHNDIQLMVQYVLRLETSSFLRELIGTVLGRIDELLNEEGRGRVEAMVQNLRQGLEILRDNLLAGVLGFEPTAEQMGLIDDAIEMCSGALVSHTKSARSAI